MNTDTAASRDCQAAAAPFLCQYQFPLCDCATGNLLLPTKEACLHISMDACRTEWLQVQRFGLGNLLPDCSQLPHAAAEGNDSITVLICQWILLTQREVMMLMLKLKTVVQTPQCNRAPSSHLPNPLQHLYYRNTNRAAALYTKEGVLCQLSPMFCYSPSGL